MNLRDRLRHATGADRVAHRLALLEAGLEQLAAARAEAAAAQDRHDTGFAHIGELERHLHEIRDDVATVGRLAQVATVTDWARGATLRTEPLVSVVLPTRNRASLLPRAIESVLAQFYANWELLVVDDASTDDTRHVLAAVTDPRVRCLEGPGRGVSAARNVAIDAAAGALVAYVDDDNRMHPDWLRAVVWAFEQRPDLDVLYGAVVIDDLLRVQGAGEGALPVMGLHRYERAALEQHNLADMGAIAHRRDCEARFDETIAGAEDWDLLLQLTRTGDALSLPALALYYDSTTADRLSDHPSTPGDIERVRAKAR